MAVLAALALGRAEGSALSDKIYTKLAFNGVSKLLNADSWIGASSLEQGSVGYLYRIQTPADVDSFAGANGPFFNGEGYIALLAQSVAANKTSMQRLLYLSQLRGVLLYDDGSRAAWSAGNVNPGYGLGTPPATGTNWNPVGGGFSTDDQFGMHWTGLIQGPVFLLSNTDAKYVNDRYEASRNFGAPGKVAPNMLGARLEFFQWAAGNAHMCLRRTSGGETGGSPFCLPLGGNSVVGALDPNPSSTKDVTVVAAPMDAVALFHDDCYGANQGAAALAAQTALARMLTRGLDAASRASATKQVYFAAFQGEGFGNIGSTAFFSDLMAENFPSNSANVPPARVTQWIELGQLGSSRPVYLHNLQPGTTTLQTNIYTEGTTLGTITFNRVNAASTAATPPSSFRKLASLTDSNNPFATADAVLLTDTTDTTFTNDYYQTRLDNAGNLGITNETDASTDANITQLCNAMLAVANVLSTDIGVSAPGSRGGMSQAEVLADCQTMVGAMLQALLLNSTQEVPSNNATGVDYRVGINNAATAGQPINRYVSVYTPGGLQTNAEAFVFLQLSAALKLPGQLPTDGCKSGSNRVGYHTVLTRNSGSEQYCFNTSTFFVKALSPAFSESGATYKITGNANVYSTWTESTWDEGQLELFIMQDAEEANALVAGGAIYFVAISGLAYLFNKRVAVADDGTGAVFNPTL